MIFLRASRQLGESGLHRLLLLGDLVEIFGGIRIVDSLAGGIDGDQPVADIGDIELAVGKALPGMRIGDGLLLAALLLDHGARLDALGRDDDLAFEAGGFLQPVHPALEAKAVGEENGRGREVLGVGRRRLVDMGVAVRADQRRHIDAVSAHLLHHVAEDRERGDGLDLVGSDGAPRETEQQCCRQS